MLFVFRLNVISNEVRERNLLFKEQISLFVRNDNFLRSWINPFLQKIYK